MRTTDNRCLKPCFDLHTSNHEMAENLNHLRDKMCMRSVSELICAVSTLRCCVFGERQHANIDDVVLSVQTYVQKQQLCVFWTDEACPPVDSQLDCKSFSGAHTQLKRG